MSIEKNLIAGYRSKQNPSTIANFLGLWKNGLGSEMEIDVSEQGEVTGTYRTNVGAPEPVFEFPLVGFASGNLITFTVNFGQYDSLTAWTGQHQVESSGEEKIESLWHLAKTTKDENQSPNLWAGILTGANTFTR